MTYLCLHLTCLVMCGSAYSAHIHDSICLVVALSHLGVNAHVNSGTLCIHYEPVWSPQYLSCVNDFCERKLIYVVCVG